MPHIWNHIGDFASLLHESWGVTYEYVPCPPIMYPEIQKEIWCHRYYLRHLCNTSKYPNWDITDHVKFLQAILGAWRTELARETSKGMTIAKAVEVLELDPQADLTEADFKKSFRRFAKNTMIAFGLFIFSRRSLNLQMNAGLQENIILIVIQQGEKISKRFMKRINVCIAPKRKFLALGDGVFCYSSIHNVFYMQDILPCFVNSNMQDILNFSQPYHLRSRMSSTLCPTSSRLCYSRCLISVGLHAKAQS